MTRDDGATSRGNEALYRSDEPMSRVNGTMHRYNQAMSRDDEAMIQYDGTMSRVNVATSRDDEAPYAYEAASFRDDDSIDGGHQRHDAISKPLILKDVPLPGDGTSGDSYGSAIPRGSV